MFRPSSKTNAPCVSPYHQTTYGERTRGLRSERNPNQPSAHSKSTMATYIQHIRGGFPFGSRTLFFKQLCIGVRRHQNSIITCGIDAEGLECKKEVFLYMRASDSAKRLQQHRAPREPLASLHKHHLRSKQQDEGCAK